ncbi:acyltransferase [Chryseolinea lacunae]|uniref:Acyltransferase n=1 Tax=Chryseolinea lacunae TaxID=2801331 RepID=A0ABS1L0D7_9BACT|nr:acyltransferase [Chryseolinea lacunae]MBL0744036.1 hypothetical protein [Chryseolinea lacunae]
MKELRQLLKNALFGVILRCYKVDGSLRARVRKHLMKTTPGIKIGKGVFISETAVLEIVSGGTIEIGDNARIYEGVILKTYGGGIKIGRNCSINPYTIIYGHGGTWIGDNVLIAGHNMIIPNNHVFSDSNAPIALQGNVSKGIVINDDVWIGHACSILDGVEIGRGCVVAAGSVVTKTVSPFKVIGGVPARIIKERGNREFEVKK